LDSSAVITRSSDENVAEELSRKDRDLLKGLLSTIDLLETAGITNLSQARVFLEVCRDPFATMSSLSQDQVGSTTYRRVQSNLRTLAMRTNNGTVQVPLVSYPDDRRCHGKKVSLADAGVAMRTKVLDQLRS
jgi:hypothetical protein